MFTYLWPLLLAVFCNTFYQICAKSLPAAVDPIASLTVTYTVAALASLGLYFVLNKEPDLLREYRALNWAPVVLGFVIVGLEAGFLYAYRAGWSASTLQVVQGILLAIVMIFVGRLLYREAITWNKLVGVAVCMAGLALINLK